MKTIDGRTGSVGGASQWRQRAMNLRQRARPFLLLLGVLAALGGGAGLALADDTDPPLWRGSPGSTRQEWTFTTDQSPAWPADAGFYNPYAPPTPTLTGGGVWLPNVFPPPSRYGHVEVDSVQGFGTLAIAIPNAPSSTGPKDIRVQVTWFQSLPPPGGGTNIVMSSAPGGTDQGGYTQVLPDGYMYQQLNWTIDPNPTSETLYLTFPGRGYVDQIVVDTICAGALTNPPTTINKWLQIPDTSPNGLDVRATDPKQLADDFRCTATGPITRIRIWGSWLNDAVPTTLPFFSVGIWDDVPVSPTNFWSHPGNLVCGNFFTPGTYSFSLHTNISPYYEQFFDPNSGGILGVDSGIWEYVFDLTNSPCWQTNGNIYWLSINVAGFDTNLYLFGWKTCPTNWNDDAVFRDVNTTPPGPWRELRRPPLYDESLDLAFEIITTITNETPRTNVVEKWLQIPDTSPDGLDVKATDPKQLADDFLCTATGPITRVRIWGSWLEDKVPTVPPYFSVGIWTDVPASPTNPWSQPGTLVCGNFFTPGTYSYSLYTNLWPDVEQFYDPNSGIILGVDSGIWEYVFDLTNSPCWQTNGNIYWLSINVTGFDTNQYLFGWKTCPTNWNDDAVFRDVNSVPPGPWQELRRWWSWPYTNSIDLAFEIITTGTNQPTDTNKWLQVPDVSTNGLDVKATVPKILADDFLCTLSGTITQVCIWGSWRNDIVPPTTPPPCFALSLWTDVPVSPTNPFSRPGTRLCSQVFTPTRYTNFIYSSGVRELFFDPNIPGIIGTDTNIWEYVITLPTNVFSCWRQTNGNIYWLSVQVDCIDTNLYLFGWKTCPTNWNDDAVFGDSTNFNGTPLFWQELRRPPDYADSLDLAFQLTTFPTNWPTPIPGQKWLQIPDTSTNGLDVKVTDPKILADDFLCTATGPLTQVRIWGSWRYDEVPPTNTPPCFALGLWTDVPTNAANPYSHPGNQLCNWFFGAFQYTNFIYTNVLFEQFFDPNIPGIIGSDTVIWEYVFDLTNFPPCWQTNGNIYWLSVQADCMDTNFFLFGWKTCPTNWNDDAVFGDTPGFGAPPPLWKELRRPPYFTNSLDLAFEIITGTNCTTPVSIICGTNQVVECGTTGWVVPPPTVISPCCGTNYTLTYTTVTNGTCPWVITYTWQVVDCIGSTASCTQTVTMVDTTAPVLTCATNKTVECGSTWSFDPPTASDLCCGTNVTVGIIATVTNGCQLTRTWLATDCCTNSINCSQTVTINDTNPPTIICPSNIVVLTCCTNIAVSWSITATDACSSVTVTSSPPSGSLFSQGTNTVTAVATDACGNSNTCSFLVIVSRPALSISLGGAPPVVTITWPSSSCLFQVATTVVGGAWTDLPLATSPYTVSPTNSPRFYRLRCP